MTRPVSKKRIAVLQPCIPDYRVSFFSRFIAGLGHQYEISFHYSEQDENGASTSPRLTRELGELATFNEVRHKSILGSRLHIQHFNFKELMTAEIVVLNWNIRYINTVIILVLRSLLRRKTIGWGHYNSKHRSNIFAKLRKSMFNLFDAFWLYTECEVKQAQNELKGIKTGKLVALNNGIDTTEIDFNAVSTARHTRATSSPARILFLGRVTKKSNMPLLLDALQRIDGFSTGEIELHIIGNIETTANFTRLPLAGIKHHGALFDFRSIFDVASTCKFLVYPGAVGLSLLHGFSLGLPAIIHSDPLYHMPEFCAAKFGINSISFEKNDAKSLASAISEALSLSAEDYKKMSVAALETVRYKYNVKNMVDNALSTIPTSAPGN